MTQSPEKSGFEWTPQRRKAAFALADGATQEQAATEADVTDRTIRRWLQEPDFTEEVDRLTLMTGIATRAARLRVAKRMINQLMGETEKDLLDWLKFAQSETTGAVNDLADRIAAAIAGDHSAEG